MVLVALLVLAGWVLGAAGAGMVLGAAIRLRDRRERLVPALAAGTAEPAAA